MATYTIRNTSVQDWRDTMMSKAEFNAVAAERRANRAGSGFDSVIESLPISTMTPINNNGLITSQYPTSALGGSNSNLFAIMQSSFNVNGNVHNVFNNPLVYANGNYGLSYGYSAGVKGTVVTLPPAPTVLPYDAVLTTEQIAMGAIKHADSSNSGLIVNGKFNTDTSGWFNVSPSDISATIVSGSVRLTELTTSKKYIYQPISNLIVGKKYVLEANVSYANTLWYIGIASSSTANNYLSLETSTTNKRVAVEFTARFTTEYLLLQPFSGIVNSYIDIDDIAVFPADAISRSDLVFLETWHEDISEKDFVYPLGNVQYLGGVTDGMGAIVSGAFSGSSTYSLFGNWQASGALVGKGYVWSTMTDAQKKAFVSNPENNCYLDGDKVIQVRYRVRVVAGMGDTWANVDPNTTLTGISAAMKYGSTFVLAKGKQVTADELKTTLVADSDFFYSGNAQYGYKSLNGIFDGVAASGAIPSSALAYEGKCFALPIALVHRRNQGAYHPVYNANGTKFNFSGQAWYSATTTASSIANTFAEDMATGATAGSIAGTSTRVGRPDGLFYDQVHEGDIVDLRNSSQKVEDYNRLIDKEFNKLVAGTTRGSSKEIKIQSLTQSRATTSGATYITIPMGYTVQEGTCIYHNSAAARVLYQSGQNVYITPTINILINTPVLCSVEF